MVRCFLYSVSLEKEDARLHCCNSSFVFEACVENPTAVVTDVVTASVTVDAKENLAHEKTSNPIGPSQEPRHGPTVGSCGVTISCKRGTPVTGVTVVRVVTVVLPSGCVPGYEASEQIENLPMLL